MPNGDNATLSGGAALDKATYPDWIDYDGRIFLDRFGFVIGDKTHHNLCCIILLIIKKNLDAIKKEFGGRFKLVMIEKLLLDPFRILKGFLEYDREFLIVDFVHNASNAAVKAFVTDIKPLLDNKNIGKEIIRKEIIVLYCIEKIKEICYLISNVRSTITPLAKKLGGDDVADLLDEANINNIIGFFILLQIPDINECSSGSLSGGSGLVSGVTNYCSWLKDELIEFLNDPTGTNWEVGEEEVLSCNVEINAKRISNAINVEGVESGLSDTEENAVVNDAAKAVCDLKKRTKPDSKLLRKLRKHASSFTGVDHFWDNMKWKERMAEKKRIWKEAERAETAAAAPAAPAAAAPAAPAAAQPLPPTNSRTTTKDLETIKKNHIPILEYIGSLIDMSDLSNKNILTIFDIKLVSNLNNDNPNFFITKLKNNISTHGQDGGKIRKRKMRKSKKKGQRKSKKKGRRKSKRKVRRKSKRKVRRHRIRTRK